MKALINSMLLMFFSMSLSCAQTQEHQGHDAHHASLDAHLEHVQAVKDPAERKKMLGMHIQMMKEKMETMASMEHGSMMGEGMGNMDHGEGGMAGGMGSMDHSEGGMASGSCSMCSGENMASSMGKMDHGNGGMAGSMMQHHNDMVNMMNQMISVQEMLLDMVEK
ncbi:MAG: hypothetical protein ACKVHQ_03780 [Gammaproteobacteria bacterium]|jgi:hypothetical protein